MLLQWFILTFCIFNVARSKDFVEKIQGPCRLGEKESSLLSFGAAEIAFYGGISFGTPGQGVSAIYDTGSLNVLVPSAKCDRDSCAKHKKYDSKKSSTYEANGAPVTINHEIGKFSGILSTDTLQIGKFTINKQTFAEIIQTPMVFEYSLTDSVLGLGHSKLQDNGEPTLLNTMMCQGLIEEPVFSLFYNRSRKQLFFGHPQFKHYAGEMAYAPVVNKTSPYWQIRMNRILIGNQHFAEGSIANINTGLAFVYGPMKEVAAINTALGGKCSGDGFFRVACKDKIPLPQFVLGGAAFKWNNYILTYKLSSGERVCLSTFVGTADETWTLGTVFLSQIYTQFDLEKDRVGFANLLPGTRIQSDKFI